VGNSVRKVAGCDQCKDAGARSQQEIAPGDGCLEFTAVETDPERYAGLTAEAADTNSRAIDFAVHLTNYPLGEGFYAEVRESGVYKSETICTSGTVFRIAIEGNRVRYYRNGELFHTSARSPVWPLSAATSLLHLNAGISYAVMAARVN
jgi:hypothetical protein